MTYCTILGAHCGWAVLVMLATSRWRARVPSRRPVLGARGAVARRGMFGVRAVAEGGGAAGRLIEAGIEKYNALDRMAAINLFEKASSPTSNPTEEELQTALLGATCSHAYFGDIELAKVTLRAAVEAGLDYETAMADPACPFQLEASSQARVQLREIARKAVAQRDSAAAAAAAAAASLPTFPDRGGGAAEPAARPSGSNLPPLDLSNPGVRAGNAPPGLETVEIKGMDASPIAVVKRVGKLVVVMAVVFGVLFAAGLQYAFPTYD